MAKTPPRPSMLRALLILILAIPVGCRPPSAADRPAADGLTVAEDTAAPAENSASAESGETAERTSPEASGENPPRDIYAVPDGKPEELLEFVAELQQTVPQVTTRTEYIQHKIKEAAAIVTAAERILKQEASDEQHLQAAAMALQSLALASTAGDESAVSRAEELLDRLSGDSRPELQNLARNNRLFFRALTYQGDDPKADQQFLADLKAHFQKRDLTSEDASLAQAVGQALEMSEHEELTAKVYALLGPLLAKSPDEAVANAGRRMEGTARRLTLLGNSLHLEGTWLDGQPLDWASYKGKVVLVDFWATWCGPCRAELPNVLANYETYHDKGFDVVAISLDEDEEAVQEFLAKNKIPWGTLYSRDPETQGWNDPMVTYYGITGIPAAILVDQNGKVVSLHARGDELGERLESLLGPAEESPKEKGPSS